MITFDIVGLPSPQGSKRAFIVGGKARMTDMGGTKAVAWRDSVANQARTLATEHGCLDGPLLLDILFRFPMPGSRPKATRTIGVAWKTTAPDSSKLLRAVEDGLQAGGLIRNDSTIVDHRIRKIEVNVGWSGASIALKQIGPVDPWTVAISADGQAWLQRFDHEVPA